MSSETLTCTPSKPPPMPVPRSALAAPPSAIARARQSAGRTSRWSAPRDDVYRKDAASPSRRVTVAQSRSTSRRSAPRAWRWQSARAIWSSGGNQIYQHASERQKQNIKQDSTEQNRAEQNRTEHRTEQNKSHSPRSGAAAKRINQRASERHITEQQRTEQHRTNDTEPNRTEQNRTG